MKRLLATTAVLLTLGTAAIAAPEEGGRMQEGKARMEEALSKLPAEKAKLVKETLAKQKEASKENWEKARTLRKEMQALMTADTFDKKAYLSKSKEIDALQSESHRERAEAMAELASKLTKEERTILSESMTRKRGEFGKKQGGPSAEPAEKE